MGIRNKLLLFSTVWLLLIVCIINTSIYWLFYKQITERELERLQLQAENITATLHSELASSDPAKILQSYVTPFEMVRVVNRDSRAIVTTAKDTKYAKAQPQYSESESYQLEEYDNVLYAVGRIPFIWNDGTIVSLEVTTSLAGIQETMRMLLFVLLLASLVVLLPSFLVGRLLGHVILEPIHSLILTMEEIQKKGIFKKLELKNQSKDELYQLGNTFNRMIEILHQNFDKQQQFVSDASHELKTPLTVIEGYATMLKRWGMKKPDVLEEAVDAIYAEAVRMNKMTKQMLLLANPDEKSLLSIEEVDLVKLVEETSKWMKNTYEQEITVHANKTEIVANVDAQKLKQLLVILLDNAVTYSKSPISIEMSEWPQRVSIAVVDRGMGIPEAELPHIFDRFYRVDKARARETGGTGLGLSIAKRIVDAHGGQIAVLSKEGSGTTFTVTIPK